MATPWRSEEERSEYLGKVKLEDVICPEKSMAKIAAEEFDNMICEDIVAVLKKYFPNSTLDEQKVLNFAKALIAEEKTLRNTEESKND